MSWLHERLGPGGQVILSAVGIYSCYLYYGVLQEKIYRPDVATGERFTFTLFLLFVQCAFNCGLAAIAMGISKEPRTARKNLSSQAESSPLTKLGIARHDGGHWIAIISLFYLGAMAFSNQSLRHVSYAFQALSKSCKMVPVMLANVFVGGKRYGALEYCATIMITAGVAMFQLYNSKSGGQQESTGLGMALLLGSLILDGLTGSNQRLLSDEYKPSSHFLMMRMNLWSLVYLGFALAVTGEGVVALDYVLRHRTVLIDIITFSICSAIGQQFIFFCIVGPGPLVCTTITTTRKFFTVLLSVVLYPDNRLNNSQWLAVFLVFIGLSVELLEKRRTSTRKLGIEEPVQGGLKNR